MLASRSVLSLGLSFFALSSGANPAKDDSTVSVRVVRLREGGITLQNVVIQQRSSQAGQPLETYEYGFDRVGLRRIFARRTTNGKTSTVLGRFEPVQSNWRGSQALTDAAVYNWNVVAPGVAVRKVVMPKAEVSPQARAIFARAVKLYSGLKGLRLTWTRREDDLESTEPRELRFDRAGRLFLKGSFAIFNVAAINGKTSIEYDSDLKEYTQEAIAAEEAGDEAQSQLEFAAIIDDTLIPVSGENPLSTDDIEASIGARAFENLRATVLPSQPFGGQTCDLVRISIRSRDEDNMVSTKQQTFWFARSDGRLMRCQTKSVEGGEEGEQTDSQITLQEFNPQFEAKDFAFTIPKGAKRSEDE